MARHTLVFQGGSERPPIVITGLLELWNELDAPITLNGCIPRKPDVVESIVRVLTGRKTE